MSKYMEGDDKNVLKLLKREGRKDKGLCVQVLHYFVRVSTEEKINCKCKTEIEGDDNVIENEDEDDSDEVSGGEESVSEEEKYVLTYAFRPFFHLFMFSFLFIFHFCLFFIF